MIGKTIENRAKVLVRDKRMWLAHRRILAEKKIPVHREVDPRAMEKFREYYFGGQYFRDLERWYECSMQDSTTIE